MLRPARALLLLAAALGLFTGPAQAQEQRIEFRGRGEVEYDAFLRRILQRPDLLVIPENLLLPRTDTLRGTVLVLDATVRVDGVIAGDIIVVDGNLFLRPSAHVLGEVHNLGGGYYPSELARIEGAVVSVPLAPYRVDRPEPGVLVIAGTARRSPVVFDGVYGVRLPAYDRVDGFSLGYGLGLLLPRAGRIEPTLRARAEYRSLRERVTGALALDVARGGTSVVVGAERSTQTNERWIQGDIANTASFLVLGKDYRDYFEADRAYAEIRRVLEEGDRSSRAFIRLQFEESRTLDAGSPWTLFGTPRDDNIVVDSGRVSSVIAGTGIEWTHPLHVLRLDAEVEAAARFLDGEHTFNAFTVDAQWAMAALSDHTLQLDFRLQGPLPGTDSLPGQRHSFIGGPGTLRTFDFAHFRGDRLVFVETQYIIPLPARFRLRLLGTPTLDLLHMAGMAWTADERPRFEQNLGLRLQYSVAFLRLLTNPDRVVDDMHFTVGVNLPRRARPWQTPR